jgi:hypothetical protein
MSTSKKIAKALEKSRDRAPAKALAVRTLTERFEDTCAGIKAALRILGHDGKHDERELYRGEAPNRRWFVDTCDDEGPAWIVLEQKTTYRGPKPTEPKLLLSVHLPAFRASYGSKEKTVTFRERADGTFNCDGAASAAFDLAESRRKQKAEWTLTQKARLAEEDVEKKELARLAQGARSNGGSTFAMERPGWSADRIRKQADEVNPVYLVAVHRMKMRLSNLARLAQLLDEIQADEVAHALVEGKKS